MPDSNAEPWKKMVKRKSAESAKIRETERLIAPSQRRSPAAKASI
jgi:hypothetical protein